MDNGEIMYWLAVVQQANRGDKEAQEVLRQEDELRTEQGQQPIIEELRHQTNKDKLREETIANLKEIVHQSKKQPATYMEEVEQEFKKYMKD